MMAWAFAFCPFGADLPGTMSPGQRLGIDPLAEGERRAQRADHARLAIEAGHPSNFVHRLDPRAVRAETVSESFAHSLLEGGKTYWLGLEETSFGGFDNNSNVGWFSPSASAPAISIASGTNNSNWISISGTAPAFEILANPVAATVPEPSSAALFGLGAAGLLFGCCRRGGPGKPLRNRS